MAMTLAEKLAAFDPNLPLEEAHTIPNFWYFDEEIFAAEINKVFANTWQVACRLEEVAQPGSFKTTEIAGEPLVILRDEDSTLRVLSNVCRHRAARVLTEDCGTTRKLRCQYHGWTYDLQGCLRGAPEFDGVRNFAREDNGLPQIPLDTWGPYVWVFLGESQSISLADFLNPLPRKAEGMRLGDLEFVESREYDLKCNWKVFIDNFQDGGYHVNSVHPGLAGAVDYSQYRNEMSDYTTVQISPFRPSEDQTIAKTRTGDCAYYWWIYPNFIVNWYSGVMDTNLVIPTGPTTCKVRFDFFYPPIKNEAEKKFVDESIAVSDKIQMEDVWISEEVQKGITSRFYKSGRFSVRREAPVYHFHQLLGKTLLG